jgi:carbamoyltransferase
VIIRFKELSGIPAVINTSFNDRGEPIVCSPSDAIACFRNTDIDYLVMENNILEKTG